MNYLALSGLITFSLIILGTIYVLVKNPKSFIVWLLATLGLSLWAFGIFKCFITNNYNEALFWGKFLNTGAILIIPFLFHFCCIMADKKNNKKIILYYLTGAVYFILAILFHKEFVNDVKPIFSFPYYPTPGWIYYFFPIYYLYIFFDGILALREKYKNTTAYNRNKIFYILVGLSFSFLGGATTFSPVMRYVLPVVFPPFGVFFPPIYIFILAYTIPNNEILDIGFLSKKLVSWFFTFGIVFSAVYVSVSLLLNNWSIVNGGLVLVYVLFIYVAVRFLIKKLNPAFLKDFETRIKTLSVMGTDKGIFHTIKDFADHLTTDISGVMNSKNVRFFSFNGETGLFELVSQSLKKESIEDEEYKKNLQILSSKIVEYLQQNNNQSIIKSTLKKYGKDKDLKDLLDKEKIEAVYLFFIGNKLMGFLTLGDSGKSYLYHKKEIEQLGYLLRVKEHIFANTYFLNLQKTIADMTQHIIDIDESTEFYHYLTSTTTRQFNIYNSIFYAYDKEKKAFVCRYKIGYGDEELPDIPETHPLLKVLNKTRNVITIEDFKIQNSKLKFDYIDDIKFFLENKVKSMVVSPLTSTNGIIGIMFFGQKLRESEYHAYDLDFIKNISTIASIKLLGFMIKEEAEIDSLTKAFNRKSLSVRFEKVIKSAKAARKVVLFIFYDIDFFKKINDSKSHDFGDKVLEELASKIKSGSRSEDMLFRLGGEEFLFVVGPIEEKDVETIKKKFLNIIHNDLNTGKYTKDLTLSMSDVLFKANRDVNDPINNIINIRKTIFRQGDDGVYTVKNNGRNNIASGGIVEDANIGEIYKNTIQIIFDDGSQNEDLGHYFRNKELDVKYSHFNDAINVFEKERPDAFLFVYDDKKKLSELKNILSEIKKRSMSAEIGIAVKSDLMKKDLKDFTSLMFFNMQEPKIIENWAKLLAKGLE